MIARKILIVFKTHNYGEFSSTSPLERGWGEVIKIKYNK